TDENCAKMQSTIGELVLNTTKGYIVFCAAQLGLVDHLANKSMNADELSKLTNTHSNSLYRLLRGLASLDFLKEDANGVFTVTETGHYLRDGVKGSIKYPILYHFGTHCVALPQMIHTLKTGETAFDHL
ncbi:methylase-like protein, partial [Leptotrombidium deliense]